MSRAFVKESDGGEELPELAVSPHRNLVTPAGLRQIEQQLAMLQEALARARGAQDRGAIARVQRDLRYWSERRRSAELVPLSRQPDVVRFGATVTLADAGGRQVRYQVVGEDEADPRNGKVSYVSPLGRALIGRESGDDVQVEGQDWEIVRIE